MGSVVRGRVTILLLAVLAVAAGIGARLTWLQVVCCHKLRERASIQHWREIEVPATRGAILDRQGRELALSLKTESLFAHPRRVEDPERAARLLAPILKTSERQILAQLRSDKRFVYLDRFLEPEQAASIRELDLPIGDTEPFGFLPSSKRYYPRGKLGVHVVGFANIDGQGVEGVEKQNDYELRGDPTIYLVLQDGLNARVRQKTITSPNKQPRDVILTIDSSLQHVVERELDQVMREMRASAASAILLDPNTGEILALANRPAADPNAYGRATDAQRHNRAVVDTYEPGSTFKIVTMAAALEHHKVRLDQWVDCERGSYLYRGRRIRDIGHNESLTARQVFEKSSNVGMVKILRNVEADELYETISRFGFGQRTGIELPGEAPGSLHPVERWTEQSKPSLSFGYEIGVTVLQMAQALAIVANDGVLVPLHVTLGVREGDGTVKRFPPEGPRRAIDSATARELASMMEGVVLRGTGTRARLPGYRLAGKSGTARKIVDGRYSDTDFVASFGGFAPVSRPELVGFVAVDRPRGAMYGGEVAAPVFRRIMEAALGYVRAPQDAGPASVASSGGRGE